MEFINSICKNLETIFVNAIFSLFWTYNYYAVIIEERMKPYGFASEFVKKMFAVTNKKVEPDLDKWNCTAVVNMNLEVPKLIEQYEYGSAENEFLSLTNHNSFGDVLYLKKCEQYMLSRIKNTRVENSRVDQNNPNRVRFLNIMYFHKKMEDPIKLKLDVSYIRNGNEIFSKTFVYRMLNYQYNPKEYYFDDTYELHIMDDKVNKQTLKSDQYLLFDDKQKELYEIKSLTK
jgi:hypothetical protein